MTTTQRSPRTLTSTLSAVASVVAVAILGVTTLPAASAAEMGIATGIRPIAVTSTTVSETPEETATR